MRRTSWSVAALVLVTACAAPEAPPALDEAMDDASASGGDADTTDPSADDGGATSQDTGEGSDDVDTSNGTLASELRYGQAGGFAGRIEELVIAPDGTAELTSRGREPVTFTFGDEELAALADAVAAADLDEQPAESMSDPAVPDAFTYEVVYDGAEIVTDEFAAPDELRPLLDLLRATVEEQRPDS